jgi:hypothetical protein
MSEQSSQMPQFTAPLREDRWRIDRSTLRALSLGAPEIAGGGGVSLPPGLLRAGGAPR